MVALGVVERSTMLVVAGVWIGLVAWWFGAAGVGRIPGWLTWVLGGFQGPALGGSLRLFDRPGFVLVVLAVPLVITAVVGAVRAHR